jgi:Flp pilus assembly protein TadD
MRNLFRRLSEGQRGAKVPAAAPLSATPAVAAQEYTEAALTHHRAGRLADAEALYRKALAVDARQFDALHMLGAVHQQTGRSAMAAELIERAVAIAPQSHLAHSNLGLAYQSLNRLDDAEASLRRAIALQPAWESAHSSLGTVLRAAGRFGDAEACFRMAAQLGPSNADAFANLGALCRERGRIDDAIPCFRKVLELRSNDVNALAELGSMHAARGELVEAESYLRMATQVDEDRFDATCNLADVLRRLGSLSEAESVARNALAMRPDDPDALNTLACVLLRTGALDEAEACGRKALSIRPDDAPAQVTLGNILNARERPAEAEVSYRKALRLRPESASACYNLSMLRLLQGDYKEGFELYESRFDVLREDFGTAPGIRALLSDDRRWRGAPLAGKRLLVWAEQGYGDCLMMLRYLPMLKARGAGQLTVLCERPLERVVQSVVGLAGAVSCVQSVSAAEFDVHCPIMSLPFLFGTTMDSVPDQVPYIAVPADLADAWKGRLSSITRPRIGLAWAGSRTLRDDAKRSIPLSAFEPILRTRTVQVISLQKGDGADQAASWRDQIEDWMGDCDDFLDSAALVQNLDLVIAVDSAMAHLAGALGKPVWLLNRHRSEWRWGLESERSTWYPSMRIFRQREAEGWDRVIAAVARELTNVQRTSCERQPS